MIERDKSGQWQMKWPEPLRVDQEAGNTLASTYAGLYWERLVDEKPTDLGTYGLTKPDVDVRVTGKDGKKHRLLIGGEAPAGGFYAKTDGDSRVFKIATGTKTSLDKTHRDLRDKRLLSFDSDKLTGLDLTAKQRRLEFEKKGTNWQIVKPSPMRADNLQVEELIRTLHEASMDTNAEDTPQLAANRIGTAIVRSVTGSQQIEFFKKGDSYYARSSMLQGTYKLAAHPLQLRNLEQYRNKKLFDFGFNEPSKIEFRDVVKSSLFAKAAEKWSLDGKPADVVGVQSLIDKLRELSAVKFTTGKFAAPVVDIAVASEGRMEKVSIAQSGSSYLGAPRE
ncbi:MAG: DUF4340 domain-containing protein [Bryobacteraceae bacterium]